MTLFTGSLIDGLSRKAGKTGMSFAVGIVLIALSAQAFSLREPPDAFRAWKASLSLPGRLMVGETSPFYFGREMVVPSAFDVHPLQKIALPGRDPGEILREARALGVTHVVVNWPEWRRLGDTYYRTLWVKEDRTAVERFLAALPVVYRDGVVSVHALGEPGPAY